MKARSQGAITVYHYANCSTCVKARRWLEANGIEFTLEDIVATPPARETLAAAIERSGLPIKRFFNTAGQSYRQGDFKTRLPQMSRDEAIDALADDGKLIKRPLVVGPDVLVGFKQDEWESTLK